MSCLVSCLVAAGCQKEADNLTATGPGGEQPALHPARSVIPAQFTETRIAETFTQATHMVVAPDGRLFVAEQPGVVRVVKNDVLLSTPFATINPASIEAAGSRGLMGIALSPNFATDRFVYLAYTRKSPLNNRIVRIRASATNPDVAETSGGFVMIHNAFELSPQGSSSAHNSMAMRFSGGLLYVATGDNQVPSNAQVLTHSAGKVLRMNPDLTPATGNPYFGNPDPYMARVWAKGLRNPWTMAVNSAGLLYVSDVGSFEGAGGTPNKDGIPREEINIVPTGPRTTEIDYEWAKKDAQGNNAAEGGGANIIHTYPQAAGEDVPGSDCAVVGGTFYEPNTTLFPSTPKFPPSYTGAYFFGDHCSGKIKYLPANQQAPQTLTGNPPAASARTPLLFASDTIQGLVQIEASPTGALYYLTRAIIRPRDPNVKGVLLKVSYAGTPIPETCTLTAPASGGRYTAPASFTMNVSAADATGGGIQKVEFFYTNSNIAGAQQEKVGEDTSAPYSLDLTDLPQNAYRLTARCTNAQNGFKDTDPVTVTVNGPTAVIDNPVASLTYNAGDTINFSGTATDPEDISVAASRFTWFIELGHGIGAGAHFHDVAQFDGVTGGSYVVSRNEELDPNVFQRITLQVQDSAGIYHTVSRDIFPNKVDATVTTSPPGLTVIVDGTNRIGPVTFQSVVGMERQVAASAMQELNGRLYQFQSWSNGGAASHTWIVPGSNPTLTANYQDVGPALTSQDIGAVSATGTHNFNGSTGTYTIEGSGADIWSTADEFRFSHTTLTGDGTITARVASIENTNGFAKAGVMMRDGTGANARNVFVFVTPVATQGFRWQQRLSNGATTTSAFSGSATSGWVRITRTGNNFNGFYSSNGTTWNPVGTMANIAMPSTIRVGLAVTSHNDGVLATGVFDNLSIVPAAPPTAPGVPTGLVCTPGNNQCACTWNAPAGGGATGYNLKRSTTSGGPYSTIASPTGTAHTDTSVLNGTTYHYVVSATNTVGESINSSQVTCAPAAPLPGPPGNLQATGGNGLVSLTWNASTGATSYTVKRSLTSGGPYDNFTQAGITGTSFTNTGLSNGTPYFYVVTASNATGESGNSNQASATPQPPPAPPTGLVAQPGNAQVTLSWTASAGATSYRVKRSTTAGSGYTSVQAGITGTSFVDTGRTNGTTYHYVVTASTGLAESGDSTEASATPQPPPPGAPGGLTATPGNAQVTLSWTAVSGATSYTVKRSLTSGGPYTNFTQPGITGTSFVNTGLTNGTTYHYVVSASNGGGEGPNSTQASATPSSGPTWFEVNVNGATPTGSYTVNGGTHTVVGGGADVPGTAAAGATDQFKWVYREITGNATIVVQLASLAAVSGQSFVKGGVMMRASTSATSMYASILATTTATNGWRYQYRLTNGGATAQTRQTGSSAIPGWLRLVRSGNSFTASTSPNGTTWTTVGSQTLSMPNTFQIGFAVTSHQQGTATTAVFDNLTITTP